MLQPLSGRGQQAISCRFKDTLGVFTAFSIFDPQKCPTDVQQLLKYGIAILEKLLKFYGGQLRLSMRETSSQLQQLSRHRQDKWKAFKLVIFEEKSLSLKELITLFLRSEAKCVTLPYLRFWSPLPWCFLCLLQLL